MAVEVFVPKMSDHMAYGEIVAWAVREGDRVEAGQTLLELQTDKAVVELAATASGFLQGVRAGAVPGAQVPVGETIAFIAEEGEDVPELPPLGIVATEAASPAGATPGSPGTSAPSVGDDKAPGKRVRAAPAARRLARELGVDLALVKGSGPDGRVRAGDVRQHAQRKTPIGISERDTCDTLTLGSAPIAQRTLARSPASSVVTLSVDADMTVALKVVGSSAGDTDSSLVVALVAWAADRAMAGLGLASSGQGLGLTVATPTGSNIVGLKGTQSQSVSQLGDKIARLRQDALEAAIEPSTAQSATLIITDFGAHGVEPASGVPRNGQSIALDLGRIAKMPVGLSDDSIVLRWMMRLVLSFDEKTLDRLRGADLLATIARLVEEPMLLL